MLDRVDPGAQGGVDAVPAVGVRRDLDAEAMGLVDDRRGLAGVKFTMLRTGRSARPS